MLDTATKRRIDTARDILVGKVPDPKSQVEQITIALIYKFMDDMDAQSEELGGRRKFFTKEFARYGWAKLMRSGLGGHEMLALYAEGITKMTQNANLPPLFRDIFKNAFLPYRDPETLRAFLKVIDEFTYDHSERLGDAFEYLLSVLGSQGDAGQFRTPRHIIDFVVALVDPKKTETVLDPACGTAGFLISAYKHILRANTDAHGELKLTPDQKAALARNFKGYDISPDMVRLSLVNLYLHGFTDPHIYEYDTLTSEERWGEFADVILANPPFMSPKGGIKPHNRFSVPSKRSEVLFVDYMAEHLTPAGRAGIIVPEGIIFQSQGAYRDLRRMLVENALVAVISLPAGCFNPYSGVKTSILLLDKALARRAQTIAFFKVENDGFGLGAQRRPIEKNDLPQVQAELAAYLAALRAGAPVEELTPATGLIVAKEKIAANGDWNLSGERYREPDAHKHSFPVLPLGEIAEIQLGKMLDREKHTEGKLMPYLRNVNVQWGRIDTHDLLEMYFRDSELEKFALKAGDVLVCEGGEPGRAAVWDGHLPELKFQKALHRVRFKVPYEPSLFVHFLRWMANRGELSAHSAGVGILHLPREVFLRLQIPLPPLEVQKEIVAEIEGYQKVINGARAVLDNYRPHIPIHPDWPMQVFGDVTSTITPPTKIQAGDFTAIGRYPVIDQSQNAIAGRTNDESALVDGTSGLVIFGDHTCAVKFISEPFAQGADGIKIIKAGAQLEPKFVYFYLLGYPIPQDGYKRHYGKLKESRIAVPPLDTQRAIIAEIEAEQELVAANRELIARMEKKIQATLARVWGEEPASDIAPKPRIDPVRYFTQLLSSVLRAVGRPVELDQLNATVALLFLPDQLLPLVESVGGVAARNHFTNFSPPSEAGAFRKAIQLLAKAGTMTHSEVEGVTRLRLHLSKIPPIDPAIEATGKHLAAIIDLIPPETIRPVLEKLEPERVREALLTTV